MTASHARGTWITALVGALGFAITPDASAAPVPANSAGQIVLPLADVATLLTAPLASEAVFDQPRQDFNVAQPACQVAADIGLPSVFNRPDLTSFHGSLLADSAEEGRYIVKQAAGVFGSSAAAAEAQGELTSQVQKCLKAAAVRPTDDSTDPDDPSATEAKPDWTFTNITLGASQIAWRKLENQASGWQCGMVSLVQDNALLQALVCERTPPPQGPATALINAMVARIPQAGQ